MRKMIHHHLQTHLFEGPMISMSVVMSDNIAKNVIYELSKDYY